MRFLFEVPDTELPLVGFFHGRLLREFFSRVLPITTLSRLCPRFLDVLVSDRQVHLRYLRFELEYFLYPYGIEHLKS